MNYAACYYLLLTWLAAYPWHRKAVWWMAAAYESALHALRS
jgi:hypothetical protein